MPPIEFAAHYAHLAYPQVTVYLPTHNRVNLLRRAVESVLHQADVRFELVVVDDASSDATPEYLRTLSASDARVRVFHHEAPRGASASRNLALREGRAELATGLDDDDYFLPGRLASLVSAYNPRWSFVCSNFFPENDGRRGRARFSRSRVISPSDLLLWNCAGSQVLSERQRFLDVGGFDESLAASQDLDMWIRLAQRYGPALRLGSASYVLDVSGDRVRISTSSRRADATRQFMRKHGRQMSAQALAYRTFIARRQGGGVTMADWVRYLLLIWPFLQVNRLRGWVQQWSH